eukprot:1158086-Pelagomonas_calceolata.AAC.20
MYHRLIIMNIPGNAQSNVQNNAQSRTSLTMKLSFAYWTLHNHLILCQAEVLQQTPRQIHKNKGLGHGLVFTLRPIGSSPNPLQKRAAGVGGAWC